METAATILAALVGAVIGSLGAEWLRQRFQRQSEAERTRREVAQRHLIQLQDALESLYFRLTNVGEWSGKGVMTKEYYLLSSVYALGNVLAHKRRLMLDGVYALLDIQGPQFPGELEAKLEAIESAVGKEWTTDVSFYRYERQALAESLLLSDGGWRVMTYAEFLKLSEEPSTKPTLDPAKTFFHNLDSDSIATLRNLLVGVLALVGEHTRISSDLRGTPTL